MPKYAPEVLLETILSLPMDVLKDKLEKDDEFKSQVETKLAEIIHDAEVQAADRVVIAIEKLCGLVDFNGISKDLKITPLIAACSRDNLKIVALLVHGGADPDRANQYGGTPLVAACMSGNLEVAKMLLSYRVDPNKGTNQHSPLLAACIRSDLGMAKMLLDKGADPRLANKYERTPLEAATNREIKSLLETKIAELEKNELKAFKALATACQERLGQESPAQGTAQDKFLFSYLGSLFFNKEIVVKDACSARAEQAPSASASDESSAPTSGLPPFSI